ncbi:MAG: hypothetical protein IJM39_00170 [Firmicutes bacterium]|nr:hypothetical protein [Bacillota bacterium]
MEKLAFAVNITIYALYLLGTVMAASRTAAVIANRIKLRHRLAFAGKYKDSFPDQKTLRLLILCGLLFLASLAMALKSFSFFSAIIVSVICGLLPLLVHLAGRGRSRRLAGREGASLVSELGRQYRMKNCNIYEAIEGSLAAASGFPVCRKSLSVLLLKLREASGRPAVHTACSAFGGSCGSLWGRMLSGCIETAVLTGADISAALEDLSEQLSSANKLREERKRLNSEAARMTVFLVPLLYAGTMIVASRFLGVELSDLLRNQFASPEGIMLLLISVFLFLVDIIVLQAVENSAADI